MYIVHQLRTYSIINDTTSDSYRTISSRQDRSKITSKQFTPRSTYSITFSVSAETLVRAKPATSWTHFHAQLHV